MGLSGTSTVLTVRAELLKNGLSLAEWARSRNLAPDAVVTYLKRWGGCKHRPRGEKTRVVIEALEESTGIKICG